MTLQSSKEILKGTILSLKEKPYEYDFRNMGINLFVKDEDGSKQKIIEYTSYIMISILVVIGIIMYVINKIYSNKEKKNVKDEIKNNSDNKK